MKHNLFTAEYAGRELFYHFGHATDVFRLETQKPFPVHILRDITPVDINEGESK